MSNWLTKIKGDRVAAVCLSLLIIFSLVAIFAYLIIPDQTRNANKQNLRLALQSPMTKTQLICYHNQEVEDQSFIKQYFFGFRDQTTCLPYDQLDSLNDQITIGFQKSHIILDADTSYNFESRSYILGTDKFGRDVLSRIILGLRVSLFIGFLAVVVSLFIGILVGSIGGFYSGWPDRMIMLLINTSWSIPTILMAFAIIIAMGKGIAVIVIAIGLTMWVDVARVVRGQIKQVKNELFIEAARVMGLSNFRIILRHILPNILGPILVLAAANFATAILVESGLSFLGLGIQPPTPSLGNMLQESYAYATSGFVYLVIVPIVVIMILVLTFNILGTRLRDIFDVKTDSNE